MAFFSFMWKKFIFVHHVSDNLLHLEDLNISHSKVTKALKVTDFIILKITFTSFNYQLQIPAASAATLHHMTLSDQTMATVSHHGYLGSHQIQASVGAFTLHQI